MNTLHSEPLEHSKKKRRQIEAWIRVEEGWNELLATIHWCREFQVLGLLVVIQTHDI